MRIVVGIMEYAGGSVAEWRSDLLYCLQANRPRHRMAILRGISIQQLHEFILTDLRRKLRRDLVNGLIVKEAELECCAYYHLRRFLHRDARWTILARKHVRMTGRYVDLLLFRNNVPRLAVELKWDRQMISGKDRESLGSSLKELGVNRAYFIATNTTAQTYQPIQKEFYENRVLFECSIPLGLGPSQSAIWVAKRQAVRALMRRGKGRRIDVKV